MQAENSPPQKAENETKVDVADAAPAAAVADASQQEAVADASQQKEVEVVI